MRSTSLFLGTALLASAVLAAEIKCSLDSKCPKEAPCCGLYGQCGVGAFCLGGCDPRMSFSLDSCVPAPTCKSKKFTMNSLNGVSDITKYLGDPKTADWVASGEPLVHQNSLLLTMPARSVGTVLSSTSYMWYGSVSARIRTSRGAGVVTAFILFSDVKDEIDYEWVGTQLEISQTNYYFQGIPNYDNSANISLSNTYSNWHTYEINWTPDTISWLVDGQVGRVKKRSDTWNATANQWNYPQTPSRVQFSIWPAGADTNPKGTVDWAGGRIDWNHEDIKTYGYYYAMVSDIEIKCYDAQSPPGTNKKTAYWYNNAKGTNDTVVDGDKNTVLKSFAGTGLEMDKGGDSSGSNTAKPSDGSSSTGTGAPAPVASIPGGSVIGPGSGGQIQGGGGSGSPTTAAPDCLTTTFTQSCGNNGGKNAGGRVAPPSGERLLGASAFAVVVALAGVMMI